MGSRRLAITSYHNNSRPNGRQGGSFRSLNDHERSVDGPVVIDNKLGVH